MATTARAQDVPPPAAREPPGTSSPPGTPSPSGTPSPPAGDTWLDHTQQGLEDLAQGTAKRVDHFFGQGPDDSAYDRASGSLAPALLWDQFDGFQPKVRFRVDLPLPQLNDRIGAFVGRVDRDEYVSERSQQSGAFERQYGPASEDQTLAGIVYRTPSKQGSRFDAGAGVRLRFPLDPYLKGSYVYEKGTSETGLLSLRETVFWQNSEHAGFTTRMDMERIFDPRWLVRWTNSATISQKSQGAFGYSELMALRGLPGRRAIALAVGLDGETDADVPLHEYGFKAAWRQAVYRDWLVLELRSSLTWPKEEPGQQRHSSFGVGIGFEMFFGTDVFLARPMTF